MTPLFKKLNFKNHRSIVAVHSPAFFETILTEMEREVPVIKDLQTVEGMDFCICFLTNQAQIDDLATAINGKLKGDAILWLCYPKASSKNYQCDFNRDTGWANIAATLNMEPVRQVAIDEDWSALRFRKVIFIKTITRRESFALTDDAKKRTKQKGK
jgi:hypothetical protein